jgi:SAM-dependent methyltransferase
VSVIRYEGLADWYDSYAFAYREGETSSASHLKRLLGLGSGKCLDVGCGTGVHFEVITSTGREVVGIDISADMLRIAETRANSVVRGDAARLPFEDGIFETVVSTFLHTDVDDIGVVFREIARVLRETGRFVYLGPHPCFVGQFVELREDWARVIHPGYRDSGWHLDSPYFGEEGIRGKVGYRHVQLSELFGALLESGLRLEAVEEPHVDHPSYHAPGILALCARKQ